MKYFVTLLLSVLSWTIYAQSIISSDALSNQTISSIVEDKKGYLWIGTRRGLSRFNGNGYRHYFNDASNPNSICSNNINALYVDKDDALWCATSTGISKISSSRTQFENILTNNEFSAPREIVGNDNGEIFVNMSDGVYKLDSIKREFTLFIRFNTTSIFNRFYVDTNNCIWLTERNCVRCYSQTGEDLLFTWELKDDSRVGMYSSKLSIDGTLWVFLHEGGIFTFDTATKKQTVLPSCISNHPLLTRALIDHALNLNNNEILFCTNKNGNFIYDTKKNILTEEKDGFNSSLKNVTSSMLDSNHNLWIGTINQGVISLPTATKRFSANPILRQYTQNKSIETMHYDSVSSRLWMSTLSSELLMYDIKKGSVQSINLRYFFKNEPYYQDNIIKIESDGNELYLLTRSKLVICSYINNTLTPYHTTNFYQPLTDFLKHGRKVWITPGMNESIFIYDIDKKNFQTSPILPKGKGISSNVLSMLKNENIILLSKNQAPRLIDPQSLEVNILNGNNLLFHSGFVPNSIYEDKAGRIWIGNYEGKLIYLEKESYTPKVVNIQNVVSVTEDETGVMWIGTLYGLVQYDLKTQKAIYYYDYHGLIGNQFNLGSVALPNKQLAFAGTHGITVFNPNEINAKTSVPIFIEEVKLNDTFSEDVSSFMNKQYVDSLKGTIVNYDQNNISISYSVIEYGDYSSVKYQYKLEGYDNQWINAGSSTFAHFSNLPPCTYTFRIRALNIGENNILGEDKITFTIPAAPWFSWYAFTSYIILSLAFAWTVFYLLYKLKMSKEYALIAKRESNHEAHINAMNMSFFANISHEFRTTLTTISGPISTLEKKATSTESKNRKLLAIIKSCAKRMEKLVSQVLDLSELESDTLPLKVSRFDISEQIISFIEMYEAIAETKKIMLLKEGLNDSVFIFYDMDKVDKVLSNLMSNALKFTPENGRIKITLDIVSKEEVQRKFNTNFIDDKLFALVSVNDTGIGIPEDKLEKIFERFYQIDCNLNGKYNNGSGIGLYYTKKLIHLHHGEIKAFCNEDSGVTFCFAIPISRTSYEESEIVDDTNKQTFDKMSQASVIIDDIPLGHTDEKPKILVVDDDVEISYYLRTL